MSLWWPVLLIGGWFLAGCLVVLAWHAMASAHKWDELARTPYQHPGWERRDVTVVPRAFDWSKDEVAS